MIRKMLPCDENAVFGMMKTFYASPAVLSNGSDEIFKNDIENCLNGSPYLEGFVFECDGRVCGYAMVAKSFSTEFGKKCVWIEDLFIDERHRGQGLGGQFLDFVSEKYADCLLRLEAEHENENAVSLYKKHGFDVLPYLEMKKG